MSPTSRLPAESKQKDLSPRRKGAKVGKESDQFLISSSLPPLRLGESLFRLFFPNPLHPPPGTLRKSAPDDSRESPFSTTWRCDHEDSNDCSRERAVRRDCADAAH